jgi:hydroxymethylpyrimidine pyrophosphatase-like HAD family hydrolase
VKLSVLALDYDGTIARGDALDPAVRTAIEAARATGITVVLVTGRRLDDLRRAAGDLRLVDGVVAENGSIVHFPESGHTTILAPTVPERFLTELRTRGFPVGVGRCLVDAEATEAPRLLDAIRTLELPLVLIFNGGRVMVLPQGVSKATGFQTALQTLRLSPRNAVAIGDAENDHELLRLAEVGVAVAWGSAALREAADVILQGSGPPDVAAYVRGLVESGCLPVPGRARRRLRLGSTEDGREFSLAVRGRNILVAGDARSGKSWVAGLLCEQLVLHGYCVCVLDPEGDYRSLEALPGVSVLGGEDPPPTRRDLLRALRYPDRSTVIDLSRLSQDEKIGYIGEVLPTLNEIRHRTGLPHRILVDEAHYFLRDGGARRLLDVERNGYIVVTYRASQLPAEFMDATEVMIVTRESDAAQIEALRRGCSKCGQVDPARWDLLGRLRPGQAVALPITEEAGGDLTLFDVAPRLTPHVRHRQKYVDVPVIEQRAFVFAADRPASARRARTLRQFVSVLESGPAARLEGYLRRGDFSRWVGEVFGDLRLADEIRALEERHRAASSTQTVPEVGFGDQGTIRPPTGCGDLSPRGAGERRGRRAHLSCRDSVKRPVRQRRRGSVPSAGRRRTGRGAHHLGRMCRRPVGREARPGEGRESLDHLVVDGVPGDHRGRVTRKIAEGDDADRTVIAVEHRQPPHLVVHHDLPGCFQGVVGAARDHVPGHRFGNRDGAKGSSLGVGRHADVPIGHDPADSPVLFHDGDDSAIVLPHQAGSVVQGPLLAADDNPLAHDVFDTHVFSFSARRAGQGTWISASFRRDSGAQTAISFFTSETPATRNAVSCAASLIVQLVTIPVSLTMPLSATTPMPHPSVPSSNSRDTACRISESVR